MPYKEPGGTWRGKVTRDGKIYTRRGATKKEAKAWEAAKRKELSSIRRETLMISLQAAATDYLKFCEAQYHRSTFTDKRMALRGLMAVTGHIGVEQVEPSLVLNEIILKQKTPNLANKRRKDLHAFFEYCRKFQGLRYNPISLIDKLPHERGPQPVPTDGELAKLMLKAGRDRQDRNMLIAFINSGARRSELFRIKFSEDVDFNERMLRLGTRKNKAREMRYRHIPMNDDLYKALLDQFRNRLAHSDYVFQNRSVWKKDEKGRIVKTHPRYGDSFTKRRKFMEGLCREAKVKPMGYHALRRYFASKLVENGEDLETVRYLLGHSNVSTTDRYIYRLKSDLRVVKAAVVCLFRGKGTQEGTQEQNGK